MNNTDKIEKTVLCESNYISFIENIIGRKLFDFEKQMLIKSRELTSNGEKLYISMGPNRRPNINIC